MVLGAVRGEGVATRGTAATRGRAALSFLPSLLRAGGYGVRVGTEGVRRAERERVLVMAWRRPWGV